MTTRECRKCGRTLPVERFPRDQRSRSTGLPVHSYTCRDCAAFRRAAQRMHPAPVSGERRTCRACGVEKPLAQFHMNNRGTREWRCKTCKHAQGTALRHARAAANPEWAAELRARRTVEQRVRRIRRVWRGAGLTASPTRCLA